jgi:hypothetical protein
MAAAAELMEVSMLWYWTRSAGVYLITLDLYQNHLQLQH